MTNALRRLSPRDRLKSEGGNCSDGYGWRTPDSIMSTGSRSAFTSLSLHYPEKLGSLEFFVFLSFFSVEIFQILPPTSRLTVLIFTFGANAFNCDMAGGKSEKKTSSILFLIVISCCNVAIRPEHLLELGCEPGPKFPFHYSNQLQ